MGCFPILLTAPKDGGYVIYVYRLAFKRYEAHIHLDRDEDSQMHSSSSEESESDAMFPNEQQQESDIQGASGFQISELSPPHSQDPPSSQNFGFVDEDMMDTSIGVLQGTSASAEQMSVGNLVSNGNGQKTEPGWAWKNKKAVEEYNRVMEMVVDTSFSLSKWSQCITHSVMQALTLCSEQYGDPFIEEDTMQPKSQQ